MEFLLKNRVFRHSLFWFAVLFFFCFESALSGGWEWSHIIIYISFLPSYFITVYLVLYWLLPKFLLKNKLLLFFVLFEIINLISIYSRLSIRPFLYPLIDVAPAQINHLQLLGYYEISAHIVVGSAISLKLFTTWYKDKILKYEILKEKTDMELNLLRTQINPHFLLNALNNMDELIFEDQEKASSYLFDLSKILQYILYECNEDKILLEREIEFIKYYIKMYSINLDKGFLEFKIEGDVGNKTIPPMLFIPLIENVIKHANKKVNKPGIKIDLSINESQIQLKTTNFIKEMQNRKRKNKGMGLNNLRKRLELLYEDNHELIIENNEIFQVELSIPLWKK